jgi:hypothetical protein
VFLTFLIRSAVPKVDGGAEMSENYRYYAQKLVERRATQSTGSLRGQLYDLLRVVKRCEAMWALEDRIERAR